MLRLRNLSLKNFLSHTETKLPFEDTSYVIIGENASGKTSILRGIFFTLFGEDIVFGKKNMINLVNRNSTSAQVEIEFLLNNIKYLISRKITPKGSQQVEVKKENKTVAKGVKVSEEYLKETLGLNPETFKNTVYVPQGELVTFLEGTPKERRGILNRLFGLQEIKEKNEKIRNFLNKLSAEIKKYEYHIEQRDKLFQKEKNLKREIEEIKRETEEEKRELKKTENLLKNNRSLLLSFENKKVKVESLRKEKGIFNEQLKDTSSQLKEKEKEKEKLKTLQEELPKLKKTVKKLKPLKMLETKAYSLKNLKLELQNTESKLSEFQKCKERIGKLITENEKTEKALKEKLLTLKKIEHGKKENIHFLEISLKELLEKEKNERALIQKLSLHEKRIEKLKKEMEKIEVGNIELLKKKKEQLKTEIQNSKENLLKIDEKLKEHEERINKLKSSNSATCPTCRATLSIEKRTTLLKESEDFLNQNKNIPSQLKENIKQRENELNNLEKQIELFLFSKKRLQQLKEEIKTERKTIDKSKQEIENLSFSKEILENLKKRYEQLKEKKLSLTAETATLKNQIEKLKGEITKEKTSISKIDKEAILRKKEKLEKKIKELHREIKEIKNQHGIKISKLSELEDEIEKLDNIDRRIAKVETEMERKPKVEKEIENLKQTVEQLREKIELIEKEIEKIDYDGKHHETAKRNLNDIEKKTEDLKENLNKKLGEINEREKHLKEIKTEIEEIEQIMEKVKTLKNAHDIVKEISEGFNPSTGFIIKLREQLLPEISRICRDLFEEFNFEFQEIVIEEDLTIKFGMANKGNITLEQLSGGQKVAFALALRFALARKFMSAFELLILDEPTIHLDEERKKELANILMKLKGKIPQMIIVTHDNELEIAGDKIIKVEKTAKTSKINFIEGGYE